MIKDKQKKLIADSSLSLTDAMRLIDANAKGILILTELSGKLAGTLTDGDIRRYLLRGGTLQDQAIRAANRQPKTAKSIAEAKRIFDEKSFFVIPIVDENNILTDIYQGEKAAEADSIRLNVPVVINAGGKGTRLDPYTRVLPKPLIPVGDVPIIEHIMQQFGRFGCEEFHIIVNYKKQLLKAYFSDSEEPYNIRWYDEGVPLGTGGGLSLLKGQLRSTVFFSNCDILIRADYEDMLHFHKEKGNIITMVCAAKTVTIPYGIVETGENGSILHMQEKPSMSFLTNTGLYLVEPEVVEEMKDGEPIGFPDVIEKYRQQNRPVGVYAIHEEDWMDMGQLPELDKMREKLQQNE